MMQDNMRQSSQCEEGLFEDLGRLREGLGFRVQGKPQNVSGYLSSPTPQRDLNTCKARFALKTFIGDYKPLKPEP